MESVQLNNGEKMPILGFGTLHITELPLCRQCVYEAIKTGYRLIDTAAAYFNEEAVGAGIKDAIADGIVKREELVIATKVWIQDSGYEKTLRAFEPSMEKLGLEYLDLYLIHQPFGDYYGSWRAMEELVRKGRIRSIGVCNFTADRLVDLCYNSEIRPAVNQIEIHPFFNQKAAISNMNEYDVMPQGWGPLSEGQRDIFKDKDLVKIGSKYGKTAAQVVLRWHIQRGIPVIPKTVHKERMEENMDIWDFQLSPRDMASIEKMDLGYTEIIDHRSPCTAKWLNEWKIHQ